MSKLSFSIFTQKPTNTCFSLENPFQCRSWFRHLYTSRDNVTISDENTGWVKASTIMCKLPWASSIVATLKEYKTIYMIEILLVCIVSYHFTLTRSCINMHAHHKSQCMSCNKMNINYVTASNQSQTHSYPAKCNATVDYQYTTVTVCNKVLHTCTWKAIECSLHAWVIAGN